MMITHIVVKMKMILIMMITHIVVKVKMILNMMAVFIVMKKMCIRRKRFQGKIQIRADFISGEVMESVMKKITLLNVVLMVVIVKRRLRFGQGRARAHARVDPSISYPNLQFKSMTILIV